MGFVVLQGVSVEDGDIQLRKRKRIFWLRMRLSTESSPLEGTVELTRGLAPFLGGGKSGSRLEGLAELLQ
ncbi:hypothetical protein MDA_GLEAN10005694 [Myotis davidii]|uniref:Uncharacterized protein n=1 Tax=Myotis davidii TaxID=225400 RepID=L5LSX3_MYODS|nr:hypothetical protein MDA_GLEAN10005694 [Myotis davidii]